MCDCCTQRAVFVSTNEKVCCNGCPTNEKLAVIGFLWGCTSQGFVFDVFVEEGRGGERGRGGGENEEKGNS